MTRSITSKVKLFEVVKLSNIPDWLQQETSVEIKGNFFQRLYKKEISESFMTQFRQYFSQLVGAKDIAIGSGWMNYLTYQSNQINSFGWHDENGIGSAPSEYPFSCVFWLAGDKNKGGQLKYLDENQMVKSIDFDPPAFIIIEKTTIHSVDHYAGKTPRVSFNFNFDVM